MYGERHKIVKGFWRQDRFNGKDYTIVVFGPEGENQHWTIHLSSPCAKPKDTVWQTFKDFVKGMLPRGEWFDFIAIG